MTFCGGSGPSGSPVVVADMRVSALLSEYKPNSTPGAQHQSAAACAQLHGSPQPSASSPARWFANSSSTAGESWPPQAV